MRKHHYIIVDVETTSDDRVADFGAAVVDRKGNIAASLGVLIEGIFGNVDFHWALGNPKHTLKKYQGMLRNGSRAIATPAFVNDWLRQMQMAYSPAFDRLQYRFRLGQMPKY